MTKPTKIETTHLCKPLTTSSTKMDSTHRLMLLPSEQATVNQRHIIISSEQRCSKRFCLIWLRVVFKSNQMTIKHLKSFYLLTIGLIPFHMVFKLLLRMLYLLFKRPLGTMHQGLWTQSIHSHHHSQPHRVMVNQLLFVNAGLWLQHKHLWLLYQLQWNVHPHDLNLVHGYHNYRNVISIIVSNVWLLNMFRL